MANIAGSGDELTTGNKETAWSWALAITVSASPVLADGVQKIDQIDVVGHYETGVGTSDAASAGFITPQLIDDRPLLRPGEVLEEIPGMIVTQHSGAGKANQYFLRGLNLEHGTDFATSVALKSIRVESTTTMAMSTSTRLPDHRGRFKATGLS
jgi:outer membrane cobalamin receptor